MQIRKKWLNQLKNFLNKHFWEYYLASFCWWISSSYENHCTLVGIWGSKPQTAKHLPRSPFTGHFLKYHHFALPSMSLIFLRISESYIPVGFYLFLLGPGKQAICIADYRRHIRTTMYRQGGVGRKSWFYRNLAEIRPLSLQMRRGHRLYRNMGHAGRKGW